MALHSVVQRRVFACGVDVYTYTCASLVSTWSCVTRAAEALPASSVALLERRCVATVVELDGVTIDTATERRHDVAPPVGDRIAPVEQHLSVLRAVVIASSDACRVVGDLAVESFVTGQLAEHAARPVLARHVCSEQQQ